MAMLLVELGGISEQMAEEVHSQNGSDPFHS